MGVALSHVINDNFNMKNASYDMKRNIFEGYNCRKLLVVYICVYIQNLNPIGQTLAVGKVIYDVYNNPRSKKNTFWLEFFQNSFILRWAMTFSYFC